MRGPRGTTGWRAGLAADWERAAAASGSVAEPARPSSGTDFWSIGFAWAGFGPRTHDWGADDTAGEGLIFLPASTTRSC
ncbi:hypothetical protein GCM10010310_57390 [Streptomyces violaceolatus]|uniref:Uncharacterized protein n=1 Tax=Streptomyces violaceolatus TaxID=67378 RepID=A0ABN3T7B9_9ACTN